MTKKIFALLMVLAFILSFAGCAAPAAGNGDTVASTEKSGSDEANSTSGGSKWDYGSGETEAEEKELTLDDAKVRLVYFSDIYAEDDMVYFLVAYYGPQEDIGFGFCNSDGTAIEDFDGPMYYDFGNGWRFLEAKELPNGTTLENIAVCIVDYADEERPSKLFTDFGEPMTNEELKEVGVTFMGDQYCTVTHGNRISSFDNLVTFGVSFKWYCLNGYTSQSADRLPYSVDDFAFFAADGTPLSEYADGYDYELELGFSTKNYDITGIAVTYRINDGNRTEGRTSAFAEFLCDLNPYMIYTDQDGVEHRFDNILIQLN